MCPTVKKDNRRKKKTEKQANGWQFPPPPPDDEEEEEMDIANPNETNQMNKEPTTEDTNLQENIDTTLARISDTMDMGRNKRQHMLDTSNSDKDNPQLVAETTLALITQTESQGGWRKVEKKKGRKV